VLYIYDKSLNYCYNPNPKAMVNPTHRLTYCYNPNPKARVNPTHRLTTAMLSA